MIEQIARAGFKVMIFSGGEPLMRPDIYELVAHAASRACAPCSAERHAHHAGGRRAAEGGRQPAPWASRWTASMPSSTTGSAGSSTPTTSPWRASRPASRRACRSSCTPPSWIGTATRCATSPTSPWRSALMAHYVFFLIPVGRGKFIQETSLEVLENEQLLQGHHDEGLAGAHRREAHVRSPVHARGEAAGRGHALRAGLLGRPHVLRHRQRGHRASLRLHDRGGGRRARDSLR